MEQNESKVFYAKNLQDLFYQIKTISGLQILGAGTSLERMPEKSISTTLIPELRQINKHERYLELGPGVTINELLDIGEHHIPQVLYEALKTIGNPFVRNIATVGGNICKGPFRLTLFAPLLALECQLETKSQNETKYLSLLNFDKIEPKFVLTKIRIPMDDWDISYFQRLGPSNKITEDSASFAFLVQAEKRVISNIRIALAGKITFRSIELENKLLGLRLPLHTKDIQNFVQEAATIFDRESIKTSYSPILRQQYLNLVRTSLEQLT